MGKMLRCPCGKPLVGRSDEDFVAAVNGHLAESHEGRVYPADMILSMGQPYPDDQIPD